MTRFRFDTARRKVVEIIDPLGNVTLAEQNAHANRVQRVVDPNSAATEARFRFLGPRRRQS